MEPRRVVINGKDYVVVYCAHFFHKGLKRRVYARDHGKACFAIHIPVEKYRGAANDQLSLPFDEAKNDNNQ